MESYLLLFVIACCLLFTKAIDPEANLSVPQIIAYNGYPVEERFVTTEDGYILGLHRIPHGRNDNPSKGRPVIFLQHGLLCSSADWVLNLRNESLAFLLADVGFDVWLGNSRGNTYSKASTIHPVDSDAFWDFTWDEMARYDLPAVLNFALNVTQQKDLYYVGHSQGTMIAFAELSQNKELARKIKKFFALGPVATVGHMESPIKYLAPFVPEVEWLFRILGVRDFLPNGAIISWLGKHFCTKSIAKSVCANVCFVICGFDKPQMNETRLDVYITHTPAGTSVKNIIHYAQAYESKKFQMYDYGKEGNMVHYKSSSPPQYNLSNFHVPTYLYSGGNDWLADPSDVTLLRQSLPEGTVKQFKEIKAWMHLDFIWGMDATQLIYYDIIRILKQDVNHV